MKLKNNLITLAIIIMPFIIFSAFSYAITLFIGHTIPAKGVVLTIATFALIYWILIFMLSGFMSVKYLKASFGKVVLVGLYCGIGMVLYNTLTYVMKYGLKTVIDKLSLVMSGMFGSILLTMIPVLLGSLIAREIQKRTKSNA